MHRLFALAGWRTGARLAELLALQWRDVDLDGPLVTIRRGKGGKARLVLLHPELAEALRWQAKGRPNERLFPFSPDTALRAVQQGIERVGLTWNIDRVRKPGVHSLRHSAARHWLANGVPVNQVAVWLGHSNPMVTLQTYLPLAPDTAGSMGGIP